MMDAEFHNYSTSMPIRVVNLGPRQGAKYEEVGASRVTIHIENAGYVKSFIKGNCSHSENVIF